MAVSTFLGLLFSGTILLFLNEGLVQFYKNVTSSGVCCQHLGPILFLNKFRILTVVLIESFVNQQQISLQHVEVFKALILSISTLFIVLSSRLIFDDLLELFDIKHLIYLLSLIFVVRPFATFSSLIGTQLKFKERLLMAWIAPRGIVTASIASLFALRLVMVFPKLNCSFNIWYYFFLLVFKTWFESFIKMIKLEDSDKIGILVVGANKVSVAIARMLNSVENIEVTVVDLNRKRVQYSRTIV